MHDEQSTSVLDRQPSSERVYAPDLEPLVKALLATLADIDFAHESEVARVSDSAADAAVKSKLHRPP